MPIYMGNGSSLVGGANLFTIKNASSTTVFEQGIAAYGSNLFGYYNNSNHPAFISGRTSDPGWISLPQTAWTKANTYCTSTVYNRGSHYDTTNTKFTAPISGPYLFIFTSYVNCIDYVHPMFYVNGSATTRRNSIPYKIRNHGWLSGYSQDCQIEEVISLVAGDYVEAYIYAAGAGEQHYPYYSVFAGVYVG